MTERVLRDGLQVDQALLRFIEDEALPGTGILPADFWSGLSGLIHDLGPENRALLARRDDLQARIDAWHIRHRGDAPDPGALHAFLEEIGYILPEGPDFTIGTTGTDPEFATLAGPQLVVPVTNPRYALNAANARWGSLYDALYGTDALGDLPQGKGYDPARGARVIAWAKDFLDTALPLAGAKWADVTALGQAGGFFAETPAGRVRPADPAQYAGLREDGSRSDYFFINNGLHIVVMVHSEGAVGASDPAGINDVMLEAAVSAIMDCEDSVACVDAQDKVRAYASWLGLMKGDLSDTFDRGGKSVTRTLNDDPGYTAADGARVRLKGRALMLVRNVGHLMTTPAIHDRDGLEAPEGLMDAMVTVMIALHDLKKTDGPRNSDTASVYVVKPKMHGPEEVAFADRIFARVEDILGLLKNTVKIGIMDEERRTSVNLKECIRAAKDRVAFINTGFLDRTGDEIHTSMEAGPMVAKGEMKSQAWISAYEDRNVDTGLACGLSGRAQIGKGMWAAPDLMAAMLEQKIGHPQSGANTAWVPSPTAAVLHATHYHRVDVFARQHEILAAK